LAAVSFDRRDEVNTAWKEEMEEEEEEEEEKEEEEEEDEAEEESAGFESGDN
jgi:CO dehydrogenase/acetyl-CoA synthase beta subunit